MSHITLQGRATTPVDQTDLQEKVAVLILKVFDSYLSEFLVITRRATMRFEQRDWRGGRRDAAERLSLYEKVLAQISTQLEGILGKQLNDRSLWISIKPVYASLIANRRNEA